MKRWPWAYWIDKWGGLVSVLVFVGGLVLAGFTAEYQALHDNPVFGQDIGGGIHTTCHGSDRIYESAHGLAVIHNDTNCDSGG